jgi:hypothetical protein
MSKQVGFTEMVGYGPHINNTDEIIKHGRKVTTTK